MGWECRETQLHGVLLSPVLSQNTQEQAIEGARKNYSKLKINLDLILSMYQVAVPAN